MNLINLSLQLNGYAIATAQKQLQELRQQVEHNYTAYTETKKTEILKHHLQNTPFYKNLVGDQSQTWEDLPVLTKQDLQQALKSNHCFPHPNPIYETPNGISYDFVEGDVNLDVDYNYLLENLCKLWDFTLANNKHIVNKAIWQDKTWERFEMFCDKYPEFAEPIFVNEKQLDPFRILEKIDWSILNNGIEGACHGDLVLDNIIVNHEKINYIDHREGNVGDVFYDICKFYHSLYLHNVNLQRTEFSIGSVHLPLTEVDLERINRFKQTTLYQTHKAKIELGVACIWLSMAPLNVDNDLNKFLFLFALDHLNRHV